MLVLEIVSTCDGRVAMTDGYSYAKRLTTAGSHYHSKAGISNNRQCFREFSHKLVGEGLRVRVLFCLLKGSLSLLLVEEDWATSLLLSMEIWDPSVGESSLIKNIWRPGQPLSLFKKLLSYITQEYFPETSLHIEAGTFWLPKDCSVESWAQRHALVKWLHFKDGKRISLGIEATLSNNLCRKRKQTGLRLPCGDVEYWKTLALCSEGLWCPNVCLESNLAT